MSDRTVDARGHLCPVPSLKLKKALEAGEAGRWTLLATDQMARIDVPHLMAELGGSVVSIDDEDGVLAIAVDWPGAPKD